MRLLIDTLGRLMFAVLAGIAVGVAVGLLGVAVAQVPSWR